MKYFLVLLAVLCYDTAAFSQSWQWAWITGSNTISQGPVYGTKGVAAAGNTPGARDGGNACTDAGGNLWLFGGEGKWTTNGPGSGFFNDLWTFNTSTRLWTWVNGDIGFFPPGSYGPIGVASTSYRPQGRTNSASWIDKQGNFWVFGGCIDQYTDLLNDLWKFNPITGQWTLVAGSNSPNQPGIFGTKGIPAPSNTPPALFRAITWTDNEGAFWLYGGQTTDGVTDDLWKYDPTIREWTWVNGNHTIYTPPDPEGSFGTKGVAAATNTPGPRIDAASWVDINNNLWLFGAGPGINLFNDLWKFTPSTGQWTWISGDNTPGSAGIYGSKGVASPANKPGCRYGATGFHTTDGKLWLFGGNGLGRDPDPRSIDVLNDLWSYDIASGQWTWVAGENTISPSGVYGTEGGSAPGNEPGGRIWSMGWGDPYNRIWLFGGSGYASGPHSAGSNNDLWGLLPTATISVASLSTTAFCSGAGVDIAFTAGGIFPSDNSFTAQLSDAQGSFTSPVPIGRLSATSGGTIMAVIPPATPSGSGYRIRILSTATGAVSADNGMDITIYGKPVITIAAGGAINNICAGTTVSLVADATGGKPPYQYQWSTGDAGTSLDFTPVTDITLQVTVSDGCAVAAATNAVLLTLYKQQFQLSGDSALCPNSAGLLNAHAGYRSYLWQDGSTDSTLAITQPGVYSVSVTDQCGSTTGGAITVVAKNCFIGFRVPSAFTPNGDGHNDLLRPMFIGHVVRLHFTVYNRHGEKVFETADPAQGWDGSAPSGEKPQGTYIWTCQYQFAGQPLQFAKGTAIVIR